MQEKSSEHSGPVKGESIERLIRIGCVSTRIGLSRATIYRLVEAGKFPAPIRITSRCIAWPESAVNEWIAARLGDRGGK